MVHGLPEFHMATANLQVTNRQIIGHVALAAALHSLREGRYRRQQPDVEVYTTCRTDCHLFGCQTITPFRLSYGQHLCSCGVTSCWEWHVLLLPQSCGYLKSFFLLLHQLSTCK